MKIKDGYLIREVAETHVVVPTGKAALDFSGMISLNKTGAFLWRQLTEDKTGQELLEALLMEYHIDQDTAKKDIDEFLGKLKAADLLG